MVKRCYSRLGKWSVGPFKHVTAASACLATVRWDNIFLFFIVDRKFILNKTCSVLGCVWVEMRHEKCLLTCFSRFMFYSYQPFVSRIEIFLKLGFCCSVHLLKPWLNIINVCTWKWYFWKLSIVITTILNLLKKIRQHVNNSDTAMYWIYAKMCSKHRQTPYVFRAIFQ